MTLIEGWKAKWHKLWSIRFALLTALFGILEQVLPALTGVVPPHVFAILSIVTAIGSAVSRVVQQKTLP